MSATATTWEGAQALREHLVPIDDLTPSEENPRRGDVMALVGSLRRFGQVRPICIDPERKVVAGHHLRLAAMEMGWTHIAAVPAEFSDDSEARAYLLADNRLSALGGYDETQQLSLMEELEASGRLEGTGFSSDDVEDYRAQLSLVPEVDSAPETWERGFSENEAEAAERAARLAAGTAMREVVLMVTQEQHDEFGRYLRILQNAYKDPEASAKPGVVACVLRSVGEAAIRYEAQDSGGDSVLSEEE